ncbi:AAA family ATPase [Microbacterium sp. LMI12-1-1.1]|uniref:AAA family ATPase n=1 Tax=Microbacterium sp. LMI12-1-1.1 TaxID=3135225 RepID=UPI00343474F1
MSDTIATPEAPIEVTMHGQPHEGVTTGMPALPSFMFAATAAEAIGFPKSLLLYGDTGTRKTTMIAELVTAGISKRAIIIDIDNGIETLMVDENIRAEIFDPNTNPHGRIIVMTVDPVMDPYAFHKVDSIICEMTGSRHPVDGAGNPLWTKFEPNPAATPIDVDLVSLDTLNVFQNVAVKFFQQITLNSAGKPDTLKAWGEVGVYTDAIVRLFQNTDRFTGAFAMHPMTDTENTGKVTIKPKLQGGTKDSVATIPSLVAYLDFQSLGAAGQGTTLTATLGESAVYTAKNRYRFPSQMQDFNLVRLYQQIAEKIGKPLPNHNPQPITQAPNPQSVFAAA